MGCNCSNTVKQDGEHIRDLAIKSSILNEEDIQIYSWTQRGFGKLYDYEPLGFKDRGVGLIEVIRFRDHKSRDVLQNTKKPVRSKKKAGKTKGGTAGKTKSGNKGNKQPDRVINESIGGGEQGTKREGME